MIPSKSIMAWHRILSILFVVLLVHSATPYMWGEGYLHPIYYRRFGFPSRPLKHGPTPKFDKDVKDRILSFVDPFYTPTTPSWEDIKPFLRDKGIDYPRNMYPFHPNVLGK